MEAVVILAYILVGILAGISGGLFGMSGGVVTVPCFALIFHFLGFPPTYLMHSAIGTSLAAMVINGIASVIAHQRRGSVLWTLVWVAGPGIFVGSILGAVLANYTSGSFLQIAFGVFIFALGLYLLLSKKKAEKPKRLKMGFFGWISFVIGSLASLLGIGGGTFTVPLLMAYQYPARAAVGTSAAIGFFITLVASIAYLYLGLTRADIPSSIGYIYLPAFIVVSVVTPFFAFLGAKWANDLEGKLLRKIFSITLILVGVLMVFG